MTNINKVNEISKTRKERILEEKTKVSRARKVKVAKYALAGTIATSALIQLPKDNALANAGIYVVQKGDTISQIANKYGVTSKQLQEVNNLKTDLLKIGQKIDVPTHRKYANQEENRSTLTHKVKIGDTLTHLAKKHGVLVADIIHINGLGSDLIIEGQMLEIPTPKIEKSIKVEDKSTNTTYEVKKNDSLSLLARRFNVRIDQIKEENGLKTDLIKVGQQLKIAKEKDILVNTEKTIGATYVVEPGDTLWAIARRFNTSIDSIKAHNAINRDYIIIGEKLIIKENNIYKTSGMVVGAIDNSSVEFVAEGKEMVLKVAYGTAENYQKIAGQNVTLFFQKSERPALISFLFESKK